MFNKKLGLLVLAAATMGLVACGGNSSSAAGSSKADGSQPTGSSKADGSQPTGVSENSGAATDDVPVATGKTTVWFNLITEGEGVLASIPSHNSIFMTGAFNGWATNMATENKPLAFTRLNQTNKYYVQIDENLLKATAEGATEKDQIKARSFQITLGWNEDSGAPADQQGIDWSYKCDLSDLYSTKGTAHPHLDVPAGGKVEVVSSTGIVLDERFDEASEGDDCWMNNPESTIHGIYFKKAKAPVEKIASYKLKIKCANWAEKKDSFDHYYIAGGFNGWGDAVGVAANELTFNNDGIAEFDMTNLYSGVAFEFKIVGVKGQSSVWMGTATGGNLSYAPYTVDAGVTPAGEEPVFNIPDAN